MERFGARMCVHIETYTGCPWWQTDTSLQARLTSLAYQKNWPKSLPDLPAWHYHSLASSINGGETTESFPAFRPLLDSFPFGFQTVRSFNDEKVTKFTLTVCWTNGVSVGQPVEEPPIGYSRLLALCNSVLAIWVQTNCRWRSSISPPWSLTWNTNGGRTY